MSLRVRKLIYLSILLLPRTLPKKSAVHAHPDDLDLVLLMQRERHRTAVESADIEGQWAVHLHASELGPVHLIQLRKSRSCRSQ